MNIPKSVVNAAAELTVINRKVKELNKAAALLKEELRAYGVAALPEARALVPNTSMVEIPTEYGTCSIIFPHETPKLLKDASVNVNVQLLKLRLPLAVWQQTFVESIDIQKGFYDTWKLEESYTKSERKMIEKVIGFEEATPRVEPAK